MSNFGFAELRLVNPYTVAFKEARSAVRSGYILEQTQVFDNLAAAIDDCTLIIGTTAATRRDLHIPLYTLESAGDQIRQHAQPAAIALLFGSEKFGLSNDDMSHCHWLLRIPTRQEHGSMNLGQAVAICLYELHRTRNPPPLFNAPALISAADSERFTALLLDLLSRSGYVRPHTSDSTELKIRRLVRRLRIPASDAETWLGILRQILWKTKQAGSE